MIPLLERADRFVAGYDPKQTVGHGLIAELATALRAAEGRLEWLAKNPDAVQHYRDGYRPAMRDGAYGPERPLNDAIDCARSEQGASDA